MVRDAHVRLGRFGDTRGVVVVRRIGRGVIAEGLLDDDTRMDGSAVDRAKEEVFILDNPMPVIEEDAAEYLVQFFTEFQAQELPGDIRDYERIPVPVAVPAGCEARSMIPCSSTRSVRVCSSLRVGLVSSGGGRAKLVLVSTRISGTPYDGVRNR